jgi:hypothetical protein
MKEFMSAIGIVVLAIMIILGMTWVFQGNDFFLYKTFAPKYENTRRQVFENTKSYNQGMMQELENFELEWEKPETDDGHKDIISSIVIRRYADYPEDRLSPVQFYFIKECKSYQRDRQRSNFKKMLDKKD